MILALMLSASAAAAKETTADEKQTVMREGFVLEFVTGSVKHTDGVWTFTLTEDVTDWVKTLKAGSVLELLNSAALEKIESLFGPDDKQIRLRLQGTVVKYDKQNYLFPTAFIPLAEVEQVAPEPQVQPKAELDNNDANESSDDSALSDEVKQLLGGGWAPNLKKKSQAAAQMQTAGDFNLVGKTGFIEVNGSLKSFRIDTLGRKVSNTSYVLLPCGSLEWFENTKYDIPGRRRYTVSGIVTSYKGQKYLLTQRLVRTYNNDNFAR